MLGDIRGLLGWFCPRSAGGTGSGGSRLTSFKSPGARAFLRSRGRLWGLLRSFNPHSAGGASRVDFRLGTPDVNGTGCNIWATCRHVPETCAAGRLGVTQVRKNNDLWIHSQEELLLRDIPGKKHHTCSQRMTPEGLQTTNPLYLQKNKRLRPGDLKWRHQRTFMSWTDAPAHMGVLS